MKDYQALGRPVTVLAHTSEQAPLAVSITEFCRLTSLGRTTAFALVRDNKIEVRRICGRTLVLMRSVERLLEIKRDDGDSE